MSQILGYLRMGLRAFRHHPGFCLVATLTLSLGVGVTSAVFSVVSGTLINPTPWDDAEDLAFVWEQRRGQEQAQRPLSYARYRELAEQTQSFSGLGIARGFGFVLTEGDRAETVPGAFVDPALFRILNLPVELGRALGSEDARPGAPASIVLNHATWRTLYASDPDIIGRTIEIEARPWTVVGVLARETWFPNPNTAILAALNPTEDEKRDRNLHNFLVLGRRAPGVSEAQLTSELELIAARSAAAHPDTDEETWPFHAQSVSEAMFGGPARNGLGLLSGAVGFLLLIACANVTGLLLTRATARQREIAVRAAVGATRGQVVAQLMCENVVLALAAVPIGLVVTKLTLEFIYSQVPVQVTNLEQLFRFDAPVWIFSIGAALATVLIFGLTPALHATRIDLNRALKEGGDRGSSGASGQWLRSALVVGQLCLSVVLLVGASLFGKSFSGLVNADTGFDMQNLFYAPVGLPTTRYPEPSQRVDFATRLIERLKTVPGIAYVGLSDSAASAPGGPTRSYEIATKRGERTEPLETRWLAGTPDYIRTMGLELSRGRYLQDSDDAQGRRVAVVSELFVKSSFDAGEDPIGQQIVLADDSRVEIVGVVQNVNQIGINVTQQPQVYVPYAQQPSPFFQLVARTTVAPLSVGPAVRKIIADLDPLIPVLRLTTGLRERALSVWPLGLFSSIMALLGTVGLVMATVGIYGVIRYSTQQRTRELGIRAALGAEPSSLVMLIMRITWWLTGLGLCLGLMLSMVLARFLQAFLYEIEGFDPIAQFGPALLLAAVALTAGALPAIRASRVNPAIALEAE